MASLLRNPLFRHSGSSQKSLPVFSVFSLYLIMDFPFRGPLDKYPTPFQTQVSLTQIPLVLAFCYVILKNTKELPFLSPDQSWTSHNSLYFSYLWGAVFHLSKVLSLFFFSYPFPPLTRAAHDCYLSPSNLRSFLSLIVVPYVFLSYFQYVAGLSVLSPGRLHLFSSFDRGEPIRVRYGCSPDGALPARAFFPSKTVVRRFAFFCASLSLLFIWLFLQCFPFPFSRLTNHGALH